MDSQSKKIFAKQQNSLKNPDALLKNITIPSVVKGSVDGTPRPEQELSDRHLRLGRSTFNKYVIPVPNFGELLFTEMFRSYPEYRSFFVDEFKLNSVDIFSDAEFQNHMKERVISKLRTIIDSLDNRQELNDTMSKLGLYHVKLGVGRRHLENIQRTIISTIRVVMAGVNREMQTDEEVALNRCFSYAFSFSFAAIEEYLEKERQPAASVKRKFKESSRE